MYLKGNVCESDNMQFCDKVYLDLKPECPRIDWTLFFCLPIPFYVSHKETVQYRYCTFDFRSKRTVWMKWTFSSTSNFLLFAQSPNRATIKGPFNYYVRVFGSFFEPPTTYINIYVWTFSGHICHSDAGSGKKIGGASSKWCAESTPLVGIGLNNLPKIGGWGVPGHRPPVSGITVARKKCPLPTQYPLLTC